MSLSVRDLEVSVAGHVACRGLSFELQAGESLAVLGRNGAGKSTLLATLAGLRAADAGVIGLAGEALAAYAPRRLAALRGYCPQTQHDAFAASVLETALIGRHPHLGRWDWESDADRAQALAALARVGLSGFEARQVHTLSGGERQRLALAQLLVQAPRLYLLDEPLAHLDLNHAIAALDLLHAETQNGATLVAVLHDPNLALRYFDRVLLLFGDGGWECGRAAGVVNAAALTRLYGHDMRAVSDAGRPWFIPE